MKKEKKQKHFIKNAYYKGGMKAMIAFLRQHLRYPKEALAHRIEGTISAKYDINHLGKVTKVKLLSRLGYGCDEEAIRLIKLLQFETPKNRGIRITYHKELQIHFKLPTPQPVPAVNTKPPAEIKQAPTNLQINYIYTKKAPKPKPPVHKKSSTITIVYQQN